MLPREIVIRLRPRDLAVGLLVSPFIVLFGWWVCSWPWSSSNAPAWVQAVGSVAAIVAAYVVANHVHTLEREARRIDGIEEQAQIARLAEGMAFEAGSVLYEAGEVGSKLCLGATQERLAIRLDDTIELIRALLQRPLPSEIVSSVFIIRNELSGAAFQVRGWTALGPNEEELGELRRAASTVMGRRLVIELAYRDYSLKAGIGWTQRIC